jgi:hypothetical protein
LEATGAKKNDGAYMLYDKVSHCTRKFFKDTKNEWIFKAPGKTELPRDSSSSEREGEWDLQEFRGGWS